MAGISLAKQLVRDRKNRGKVIAVGRTSYNERYVIIKLDGDRGRLHQIDYGSDIRLDEGINLEDIIELKIVDEYTARWEVVENGPKQIV